MEKSALEKMRKDYAMAGLSEKDVCPEPMAQFSIWLQEAVDRNLYEPNAMTLATATPEGIPSARVVLLKGITEEGFVFYTNYTSRKGKELLHNPNAALVFLWGGLEREVRIEGMVRTLLQEESEQYFRQRPRESQISAAVSPQSQEVNKTDLEASWKAFSDRFEGQDIPFPMNWGGYELIPEKIEFWQGRPGRFHDRILYSREGKNWRISRLAP